MKIVCLSTYPVDAPRHGGQHRLANIIAALRAAGHDVQSAGVAGSPAYPQSPHFIDFPGEQALATVTDGNDLMDDWGLGELFGRTGAHFSALADAISAAPDAIYVEQPWMFRFAELFNGARCGGSAPIFYGSQNIEHRLKFEIVSRYKGEKIAAVCRDKILACEIHALERATQTFCVSKGDIQWSRRHTQRNPVLAANGVIEREASIDDIIAANTITDARKFALYCASAHPPNVEGFFDLFGSGAGCFPPRTCLVTVGGAGIFIKRDQRLHRVGGLARHYIDAGEVSEEVLSALLTTAHMIVLPLTSGGGTNLKAAEAIWSGHHVVGTSVAMRGFERFSNAPGINIADDGPAFCAAIRDAFLQPNMALDAEERANRSSVLWKETLSNLIEVVSASGAPT